MRRLKALLVFRPINLVILAATQVTVYYFLGAEREVSDLLNPTLLKLLAASIILAMAGNLHNDMVDVLPDQYNKPDRNYSTYWAFGKWLWLVYILLVTASILLGISIVFRLGYIFLALNALLFLYNLYLQKMPVIGNAIIALISAFSIIIVGLIFPGIDTGLLFFYGGFAFMIVLNREIIKDAQDAKGDGEAGYKTLPLLIGLVRTNRVIANLVVFTIVLFVSMGYHHISEWFTGTYRVLVTAYCLSCIVLPLAYISYVAASSSDVDYGKLSMFLKYVMVTGLASLLFF